MSELKEFTFVMIIKDKEYEERIGAVKHIIAYQLSERIADMLHGLGEYRITLHWSQTIPSGRKPGDREIQLQASMYKVEELI